MVALAAAACSSAPAEVAVGGNQGEIDEPPASSARTEPADTVPGTAPPEPAALDRNGALLTEDDVAEPWEPPSFSESPGWDVGPNQTDCDAFWDMEAAAAHPFSHRLWFQPGANLNHDVFDTGPDVADAVMAAAARLVDECPTLSWGEGGTTSISGLPVDVDGVVAFELFDGRDISWHAYASRSNLVSRLWRVHFEPGSQPSGEAFDEFERLAVTMVDRLGAVEPGHPPTTTTWSTTTSTSPTTTSRSPTTTTSRPDDHDDHPLVGLLLTESDVSKGLVIDETSLSTTSDPEDQLMEGCDASQSIATLDGWFGLQRSFTRDGGLDVLHIVGRASSAEAAADAIAEFALIGDCTSPPNGELEVTVLAGGTLDGIDDGAATWLEMRSAVTAARFVAYHRGDVVGVVILGEWESNQLALLELHRQLVQSAVDRADS